MREKKYNREKAVEYAHKWAYSRNPAYYNFDPVGGDCTSFVSQCIYAGSKVMNYQTNLGWYYRNGNDKSPSWSGVEYLYQFLIHNKGVGPYGKKATQEELERGDIIQLLLQGEQFGHTAVIVEKRDSRLWVATHTFDSDYRDPETYPYQKVRYIHIQGVRNW